ncbi:hemerythrin domain-containing protein [Pseudonocardia xinjiangensis]|uniref:Hemerythrin domain-containing protein n=1 Tax=Pseudonocardia xinjiangensis TaxID=75289 RepID=A0ABX1RGK8_9PSEU|nr:hemerythrin domain-containing protein [Pseudonocardia xinjiangensis]NMH79528.1 hemerythrin domain-containing protein [Pseudonocardia xinjiangensis]
MRDTQATAVVETRLVHDLHRRVSTVLAETAARPAASVAALTELRDFLVVQLETHHECEDHILWPMVEDRAPGTAEPLARLSAEHDQLDAALDALAEAPIDGTDRTALVDSAVALRDLVHTHLEHEEPVLLPALREHVSEEAWEGFVRQVRAATPDVGTHLLVGFLEQVGTPEEADIVLRDVPAPVRAALREQAQGTLDRLTGDG